MSEPEGDAWQSEWLDAVYRVAQSLKVSEQTNPWPEHPLLPEAINYLMTELWDQGFSQTQIKEAFEAALADMPRYTAGEGTRR